MILTAVELTVCIIIGILPGISSFFIRRYTQRSSESRLRTSRSKTTKQTDIFVPLSDSGSSRTKVGDDIEGLEFTQLGHVAVAFADERVSPATSTDKIFGMEEVGIREVTDVSVTTHAR
jgi:hypothetical protein